MIAATLALLYYGRQPGVVLLVSVCQGLIYKELVSIAIVASKETQMPGFSWFYYYWFAVCGYYMYAKTLQVHVVAALTGAPSAAISGWSSPVTDDDDPEYLQVAAEMGVNATLASVMGGGGANGGTAGPFASSGNGTLSGIASYLAAVISATASGGPGGLGDSLSSAGGVAVRAYPSLLTVPLRLVALSITQFVPIAFALYTVGFVAFVISLRQRRNFRYQFSQFAYCHIALAVVVVQSTCLISNAYRGLLWFLLPCGLVVVNDSFAYITGFFFGRTPLIKRLSPKKTWEGFVGGAISTFAFAWCIVGLAQSLAPASALRQALLCPIESGLGFTRPHCDSGAVFDGLYARYPLASFGGLGWLTHKHLAGEMPGASLLSRVCGSLAGWAADSRVSRMQLHALALAAFASAVAPFGGFFASGFKRAFKIKDFGSSIPGHGGFTDRMDCQIVMGAFSYVYARYILRLGLGYHGGESDVTAMFTRIVAAVAPGDLVRLYEMLSCFLASMGYLTGHDGEDGGGLGLGDTARGADAGNAQAMRALAQSAARACISGLRARAAHAADPIAAAVATAGTIEQVAQAVGLQAGAPG